jgi:predicted nucleotidyltransferase
MSRIFSWQEICDGHVPTVESLLEVREHVRDRLSRESSIIGAILCGSAMRDPTISSDVDVFVMINASTGTNAFAALRECARLAIPRHVALEVTIVDDESAKVGLHNLSTSFLLHMRSCVERGGLIREDPLGLLWYGHDNQRAQLKTYLQHKMHKMQKLLCSTTSADVVALAQETLDMPIHVARKLLRLYEPDMPQDGVVTVCEKYAERFPGKTNNVLQRVRKARLDYDAELARLVRLVTSGDDYAAMLDKIVRESFDVMLFIREIGLKLHGNKL